MFFVLGCVTKDVKQIESPNVIYILADDLDMVIWDAIIRNQKFLLPILIYLHPRE